MCGRFVQGLTSDEVSEFLTSVWKIPVPNRGEDLQPSYNVAPSQSCSVVVMTDSRIEIQGLSWGVPSFATPNRPVVRPINARVETVSTKPTFKRLYERTRCIIVADGYYEWAPNAGHSAGRPKTPFYLSRSDGTPILMAGIWAPSRVESEPASFAILTTGSKGVAALVHSRMPVILRSTPALDWIHAPLAIAESEGSFEMDPAELAASPVSTRVNNPKANGPELIESVERSAVADLFHSESDQASPDVS